MRPISGQPYSLTAAGETRVLATAPLYIGMDVGRYKDLSVIVTAVKLGDVLSVIDVTELRKMPFADQLDVLLDKCGSRGARTLPGMIGSRGARTLQGMVGPARRAGRVAAVRIDATGIGAMLAEPRRPSRT